MQDSLIKKLWHTNRKCFIEQFSILQTINSDGNYEHTYFEYNPKTQELERLSTCQIKEIQCTGLKDKNGKLIYEGDILDVNTGGRDSSGIGFVEYTQAGCNYLVIGFLKNPSNYYTRRKGEFCIPLQQWLCTEIIGNIYENPELIKEAQ